MDVDHLHELATTCQSRAEAIRSAAIQAVSDAEETPWHGLAADGARNATQVAAWTLRRRADDHDRLAALLVVHAQAVADALARIEAVRDRVIALAVSLGVEVVDAAGDTIGAVGSAVGSAVGEVGSAVGAVGSAIGDGVSALTGGGDETTTLSIGEWLAEFTPPPAGDPAWLDLDPASIR